MIVLDYRDRRPLYEQVTERLEELMFQEILTEIQSFPQSAALRRSFPSIPIPSSGHIWNWSSRLICPVKGKGSFVTDSSRIRQIGVEETLSELKKITEKGMALGVGRKK